MLKLFTLACNFQSLYIYIYFRFILACNLPELVDNSGEVSEWIMDDAVVLGANSDRSLVCYFPQQTYYRYTPS